MSKHPVVKEEGIKYCRALHERINRGRVCGPTVPFVWYFRIIYVRFKYIFILNIANAVRE